MKNKFFAALFAFAVSFSASAAVVYNNGAPTVDNGYSVRPGAHTADDFNIAAGANIHSVGFYFQNYYGITGWDNQINYRILSDIGGNSGVVLASGAGQSVTASESGYAWCCGGNAWLVDFTLASDFIAAPGQSYWLELSGAGGPSPWWVTTGSGNAEAGSDHITNDMAFTLSGAEGAGVAVPEPGSVALLALGILGFTVARRRTPSK